MADRQLTESEVFDLNRALQMSVLESLLATHYWLPGELNAGKGAQLMLPPDSPDHKDGMDQLVDKSLRLESVVVSLKPRLADASFFSEMNLSVGRVWAPGSPAILAITIGGGEIVGGVQVAAVDFGRSAAIEVSSVRTVIRMGPQASAVCSFGPATGSPELYVDKLLTLGASAMLKARDVLDVVWLRECMGGAESCSNEVMRARLAARTGQTNHEWVAKAQQRRQQLAMTPLQIEWSLKEWLPALWPVDELLMKRLSNAAATALDEGLVQVSSLNTPSTARTIPKQHAPQATSTAASQREAEGFEAWLLKSNIDLQGAGGGSERAMEP